MGEQLTEREQQTLDHVRKAEELEVSLAEYCRSFDLDVKELYNTRQGLVKKGILPKAADPQASRLSDFIAVQVQRPTAPVISGPVCRIRHPSGLLIEG